jgi:hypothetical protein
VQRANRLDPAIPCSSQTISGRLWAASPVTVSGDLSDLPREESSFVHMPVAALRWIDEPMHELQDSILMRRSDEVKQNQENHLFR